MPEYEGYKIIYEVIAVPKGKWAILVEIIRREDGVQLAARHNPFPDHPFDTKLEALDQVKRYLETKLEAFEQQEKARRRA